MSPRLEYRYTIRWLNRAGPHFITEHYSLVLKEGKVLIILIAKVLSGELILILRALPYRPARFTLPRQIMVVVPVCTTGAILRLKTVFCTTLMVLKLLLRWVISIMICRLKILLLIILQLAGLYPN